MSGLTRSERKVLTVLLALLLVGWAVKAWRGAQPPSAEPAAQPGSYAGAEF